MYKQGNEETTLRQSNPNPPQIDIQKLNAALVNSPKGQKILYFKLSVTGDIQSILKENECPIGYFLLTLKIGSNSEPKRTIGSNWVPIDLPNGYCCLHNGSLSSPVSDCSKCKKGECYKFKDKRALYHLPSCEDKDVRHSIPSLPEINGEKLALIRNISSNEEVIQISLSGTGEMKKLDRSSECPKGSFLIRLEKNNEELSHSKEEWIEVDAQRIYYCFTRYDGVLLLKDCKDCYAKEGLCYKFRSSTYHNPKSRIMIAKQNCWMCCTKPPDCLDHDPVKTCVEVPSIPTQPKISFEMLEVMKSVDSNEKLILLCQNATTGKLTRIEKVEECPEGDFLLQFELDHSESTNRIKGYPPHGYPCLGCEPCKPLTNPVEYCDNNNRNSLNPHPNAF